MTKTLTLTTEDAEQYLQENIGGVLQHHYYAHELGHNGGSHADSFIDDYFSYYDEEEGLESHNHALSRAYDDFEAACDAWVSDYVEGGRVYDSPVDWAATILPGDYRDCEQFCYDFDCSGDGYFLDADSGAYIDRNDEGSLRTTSCYVVRSA